MIKSTTKSILKAIGLYGVAVKVIIFFEEYPLSLFLKNTAIALAEREVILPPARLRHLVSGSYSLEWFLSSGKRAVESIENGLKEAEVELEKGTKVLDFGCGCSRVIQHLKAAHPDLTLKACDYNPLLVNWCRDHIDGVDYFQNQLVPPLDLEDGSLDLIYQFSVFTHLTQEQQDEWMDEFHRVLKPGGVMIVSTHGLAYRERVPETLRAEFDAGKMVVQKAGQAGENHCAAYHPPHHYREADPRFEELAFIEKGAWGNPEQDMNVIRKRV